jgi:hypothetical protein
MRWILIVAAVICEGFAYWGLKTVAGRAAFDEMAGMIPLVAAPVGLCFAIAALVLWWRRSGARRT